MLFVEGLFKVDGEERIWAIPRLEEETLEQAIEFHVNVLKRTHKSVEVVKIWEA